MSGGREQLGDDEAGFENFGPFVLTCAAVGVLHVEPELRQRLVRFADLCVGVAGMVGAVEDVGVGRRQMPAVVVSDAVEECGGTRVLPGVEQRGGQEVPQLKREERVVTGALDAVLEEADRFGRSVVVQQRPDVGLQQVDVVLGERGAAVCRFAASGRGQQRSAKRAGRVADPLGALGALSVPEDSSGVDVNGTSAS